MADIKAISSSQTLNEAESNLLINASRQSAGETTKQALAPEKTRQSPEEHEEADHVEYQASLEEDNGINEQI